jgi:hypothetical protein
VTDLLPPPAYVPTWGDRARRYRRTVADWCEICEVRAERRVATFAIGRRLQVHHRYLRGVFSTVGLEGDDELMTVCVPCHNRIHTLHRSRYGHLKYRDYRAYAEACARVTRRVHRAGWWRRVGRRALHLGDLIEPIDGRRL